MTEDEARNKQCRVGGFRPSTSNYDLPFNWPKCCASSCMHWRWDVKIERRWISKAPEGEGWQRVEAIGGIAHWARTHDMPQGHCGLAGRVD